MGSHYTVSTYTKDETHSSSGQPIVAFHLLPNRFGGLCLSSVEAGAADAHLCVASPLENFTQKVLVCCFVLFASAMDTCPDFTYGNGVPWKGGVLSCHRHL